MAYDLEEQEQLDEIKAWWKRYGSMISYGLLAVVLAYAAFQAWHVYQNKQSVVASAHYQALLVTDVKDLKSIQTQATALIEDFSSTPYAGRAALFVAKSNYAAQDTKSAKLQLTWAIDHAKESTVSALAGLQLANILAEENDLEGALKVLNAKHDEGFKGLYADLKGDVLVSLGKKDEAKVAYEEALKSLDPQGKYRTITQQKLEALG